MLPLKPICCYPTLIECVLANKQQSGAELCQDHKRIQLALLTLVNAGYFFEEITRGGAQTSAPPKIPFIS